MVIRLRHAATGPNKGAADQRQVQFGLEAAQTRESRAPFLYRMGVVSMRFSFGYFFCYNLGVMKKRTIYLDHAAATPLDTKVLLAMRPYLSSHYGNPSSLHHKGVEARGAVEAARKTIADVINARPEEIVFTSGGTEACNLAILGALTTPPRMHSAPLLDKEGMKPGHIITSMIEHHAVLEPIKLLKKLGWKITYLPVDVEGFISVDDLKKAIRKDTVLVSVMYANNEIGSIQPIAEIGKLLNRINQLRIKDKGLRILLHTDACQAAGALDLNVNKLQVDLMSVSASKIYGPKGVGFLYARRGTSIAPIIHGGGQERGMRSGTENVAGIVGMAKAMELAQSKNNNKNQNKRLAGLRDYCIKQVKKVFPKALLNGPGKKFQISNFKFQNQERRLPNNINFTFPGVEGEALMLYLDAQGICVSTGSACATGTTDASHVLTALGRTQSQAKGSIRLTLGKQTKKSDLDYFIKVLKQSILLILDER